MRSTNNQFKQSRSQYYKMKMQRTRELRRNSFPGIYRKFIAEDMETGKRSTAITLSRGRIAIGDDVWRMSNRADTCDYPYKIVDACEFKMFYREVENSLDLPPFYIDEDEKEAKAVV